MDTSLRDAFVNGVHEVYSRVYTDQIKYYSFNEELSPTNIYGESKQKEYRTAVVLVGKVSLSPALGDRPEEVVDFDAMIKIPKKSFDLVGIATPLDTEDIIKGKFEYKDKTFEILTVKPGTPIVDTSLFYIFTCKEL